MAANRDRKSPTTTPVPAPAEPPYYIATAPLFIGDQFGRAFNPGDRVPAQHVATYGWQNLVRPPDGWEPAPPQTPDKPDAKDGQATTSSEGKDA